MYNPYRSKEFKKLQSEWYKKLADTGFDDIEYANGQLYQPNLRTLAWENRDAIQEFFDHVLSYLNDSTTQLTPTETTILNMWAFGHYLTEISAKIDMDYQKVAQTVYRHKKIVLERYY